MKRIKVAALLAMVVSAGTTAGCNEADRPGVSGEAAVSNDEATGYGAGDLRGLVRVTVPRTEVAAGERER